MPYHYLSNFSKYKCPKSPVQPVNSTHFSRKKPEIGELKVEEVAPLSKDAIAFSYIVFFFELNESPATRFSQFFPF